MIAIFPLLYVAYKFLYKTKVHHPKEVDFSALLAEIEAYEAAYKPAPPG